MTKNVFQARLSVALLTLCAFTSVPTIAHAAAQAPDVLTVSAKLKDGSPGDGQIRLSKKRGPFAAGTIINAEPCPVTSVTPAHSYTAYGVACPVPVVGTPVEPPVVVPPVVVEPPVTPPAPPVVTPDPVSSDVVAKLLANGEAAFKWSDGQAAFGSEGSLGTLFNVGKPFVTDAKNGFLRLSFFTGKGDDLFLHGRSQDIASYIVSGRAYHAGQLHGYRQIRGVFLDPFTWSGETVDTTKGNSGPPADGIKITQQVAIDGTALLYRVRITNARLVPVTVTYYRSEDPDSKASFATQNRVPVQGTWTAGMTTGETYFIESSDPGVFNATQPYDKVTTVGARRDAGYNVKSDVTLQLVWPAKLLDPGQSMDVTFRQGVR